MEQHTVSKSKKSIKKTKHKLMFGENNKLRTLNSKRKLLSSRWRLQAPEQKNGEKSILFLSLFLEEDEK